MAGAAMLALGTAATADVKAGADAWSRGDYAAAVSEWQAPAEAGDPDAQFDLGQAYRLGRGVPRDLKRAETLFGKAAAQGHVQAADNYGLLMFDRGDRTAAMPYIRAAADRGDPRAQYLLAIAHFNGDLAPKDWTRAYALMTLAQGAGLPQAAQALPQMDKYIPLAQRQSAATLATQIAHQAETSRAAQLASADLGAAVTAPPVAQARPVAPAPGPEAAVPSAVRTAAGSTAATAGADYARPVAAPPPASAAPTPKPAVAVAAPPKPAPAPTLAAKPAPKPAPVPAPATSGKWRVQLGAFGLPANADALWAKVRARPELTGHPRLNVPAGKVTKLQAGGFATREAASAACTALGKAGFTCLPAQD